LGKEFGKLQKLAMSAAEEQAKAGDPAEQKIFEMLKKFSGMDGDQAAGQLSVMRVTPEGIVMESHSNGDAMSAAVPLILVGGTGVAASMLLPALAKAKSKAQDVQCQNNLRQIEFSISQWALEKRKADGAQVKLGDLAEYFAGRAPMCAGGGEYILTTVGKRPRCTLHSHPEADAEAIEEEGIFEIPPDRGTGPLQLLPRPDTPKE
jgi:hypothetical protein